MAEARRIVRRTFGRDYPWFYRRLAQLMTMIVWPPAVLLHCWQIRRSRGAAAVPTEHLFGAVWAALRHNILPGEYYAYQLWKRDRQVNIDNYLYSSEAPRLFKTLNRPRSSDAIADKLAFYEMCKACALPTPAVLAVFTPAGDLIKFDPGLPLEQDLFIKPRLGRSGGKAERFRWLQGEFLSDRGYSLKANELQRHLSIRARNEKVALLVQPVLLNHPDLKLHTSAALATARLVTGRFTDGRVVPIFSFIYFATSKSITSQHAYVALVDITTGYLLSPPRTFSGQCLSDYPTKLPDWESAAAFVQAAHDACPNYVFVGWDIAFTTRGPMLLEGNENWVADEYQAIRGAPLGSTEFVNVLKDHLGQCD